MDLTPQPWMARAACREHDAHLWYSDNKGERAEAIRICHGCGVRAECGEYADQRPERSGVWGGKDFGHQNKRNLKRGETK